MTRRFTLRLRSRLGIAFALSLVALQSVAPTPPAMAGLVLIIGLHLLAYLWLRLAAAGLRVTRQPQGAPTFAGDAFAETLTITSRAWAPLLWGEVWDAAALPGYAGSAVIALPPRASSVVVLPGRALRRGIYALGPVTLTTGDPFGLYEARLRLGAGSRRVVYPRPRALPPSAPVRGMAPVEGPSGPNAIEPSPHAVTVRPYVPGDTPRRIHWRTTARRSWPEHDALFVKEFDPQSAGNLWVALDLQADAQFGEGDEASEERAIVLAASLAEKALRRGRGVGLLALGASTTLIPPRTGPTHRWRLLEELAGLRAEGSIPLVEGLVHLAQAARRGDAITVITTSPDEAWVEGVRALLGRGAQVEALVLAPDRDAEPSAPASSLGGGPPAVAALAALADLGVPCRILDTRADPASRLAA